MKKRVRVQCYDPISADLNYRQPWSDVWIRFKAGPGRKIYTYAPTLLSRPELHTDIRMAREDVSESEGELAEVERLERINAHLASSPVYIDTEYPDRKYPNIYTAAEWIDRQEAEAMLHAFMATLGFRHTKFQWKNNSFIITPVSFAS
jgi:hypothetical protein